MEMLIGQRVLVDHVDDSQIEGCLSSVDTAGNITVSDAVLRQTQHGASESTPRGMVHLDNSEIMYMHVPPEVNALQVVRARLQTMAQGRKQFHKHLKKKRSTAKPLERLEPLVSGRVTEAQPELT